MPQLHEHTAARRQAVQVLYQHELTERPLAELASEPSTFTVPICPKDADDYELVSTPLAEYARALVAGVADSLDEIDAAIAQTSENWALERMPVVDRNIIRVAVYEIARCDEIPVGVAINEAVEVAKMYGGDESPKFVNGVLGRIATKYGEGDGVDATGDADADAAGSADVAGEADAAGETDAADAGEVASAADAADSAKTED